MSYDFTLYLSFSGSGKETLERNADKCPVPLLVSVPYLEEFMASRSKFNVRRWMLDSGAFSNIGGKEVVPYSRWLEAAKSSDADEVVALDVWRDATGSRRNWERAMSDGVARAMPTVHYAPGMAGVDEEFDFYIGAGASKIGLGGIAKQSTKTRSWFVRHAFARTGGIRLHAFAVANLPCMLAAPLDSSDASSWSFAPSKTGNWCGPSGTQQRLRIRNYRNFWWEVVEHLRREQIVRAKWKGAKV